jgi:hypothetical protein
MLHMLRTSPIARAKQRGGGGLLNINIEKEGATIENPLPSLDYLKVATTRREVPKGVCWGVWGLVSVYSNSVKTVLLTHATQVPTYEAYSRSILWTSQQTYEPDSVYSLVLPSTLLH